MKRCHNWLDLIFFASALYLFSNAQVDVCDLTLTCQNGGTCDTDANGASTCQCLGRFLGHDCGIENVCSLDVCLNNGVCSMRETGSSYVCSCLPGYNGTNCEIDTICFSNPCQNAGTCVNLHNGTFTCNCVAGIAGEFCDEFEICDFQPCQNGGTCNADNGNERYTCLCPIGYVGIYCEIEPCEKVRVSGLTSSSNNSPNGVYQLSSQPQVCNSRVVYNQIDDQGRNTIFFSIADDGLAYWVVGVYDCATNASLLKVASRNESLRSRSYASVPYRVTSPWQEYVNDTWTNNSRVMVKCAESALGCSTLPCRNGGTCSNDSISNSSFVCRCTDSYIGDRCELVNWCSATPCLNGGSCVNLANATYNCSCIPGFVGRDCQTADPCLLSPCSNDGTCVPSSNGTFTCLCTNRFVGAKCETAFFGGDEIAEITIACVAGCAFIVLVLVLCIKRGHFKKENKFDVIRQSSESAAGQSPATHPRHVTPKFKLHPMSPFPKNGASQGSDQSSVLVMKDVQSPPNSPDYNATRPPASNDRFEQVSSC